MARLLFVTPEAPFPSRNGVTVPVAALAERLIGRGHTVEVAWLRDGLMPRTGEIETTEAVSRLVEVPVERRSLLERGLAELLGSRPAFDRWILRSAPQRLGSAPDLIWATPRSAVGSALALRVRAGWPHVPVVAAINDVWTGVLDRRAAGSVAARARWPLMRRAEASMLARADHVVVQSARDRDVATRWLGLAERRVTILSNGVADDLFLLPLTRPRTAVGWVGDARGRHYRAVVRRLVDEVWPQVCGIRPYARLCLVGPGTAELDLPEGVSATGFVPSISEAYAPFGVLIAPVFKGHGRINKVIEAMAAGVPVVGDATAFHGIPNFTDRTHGVVAHTWDRLAEGVVGLLDDTALSKRIAQAGRTLARGSFDWSDRVDVVDHWLRDPASLR